MRYKANLMKLRGLENLGSLNKKTQSEERYNFLQIFYFPLHLSKLADVFLKTMLKLPYINDEKEQQCHIVKISCHIAGTMSLL